jgi:phosphoserine phosphatase RsbU/P
MSDLAATLAAFREASGCAAAVWEGDSTALTLVAGDVPLPAAADRARLPAAPFHAEFPGGVVVVPLGLPMRGWVAVQGPAVLAERWARFLAPVCTLWRRRQDLEGRTARELAERYEEIDLLHTTAEILGRSVRADETAGLILRAIGDAVGARRGLVWRHDAAADRLVCLAALGAKREDMASMAAGDLFAVSSRALRDRAPIVVAPGDAVADAEALVRDGELLAVPVVWAGSGDGVPLGVVVLSARRGGLPFAASDVALVSAVAAQLGIAIQNAALVRDSADAREFAREMQLAHDLQMKLLPKPSVVAPHADAAARVVPADEVGGDFYHLFRLSGGRTGVMIADVSGHGYRAAMIMALAISAAAVHAQIAADPGTMLGGLAESLADELEQTEMFLTACYAVVDPSAGTLQWANAGHPHAWVLDADGTPTRLETTAPPVGMAPYSPPTRTRPWATGTNLLVWCTDGLVDARNKKGQAFGETRLLELAAKHVRDTPQHVVDRIFEAVRRHAGDTTVRDDLTMLALRA